MRPICLRSVVPLLGLTALASWPGTAVAQVQLRCEGTLLEARGSAEQERPTRRLAFSLSLEAEAATADGALQSLQERLAAVRTALQGQQVEELRVTSPTTWKREAERNRPAAVTASLQVSGRLVPQRLQALIREVGGLPGVRLAPVAPAGEGMVVALSHGLSSSATRISLTLRILRIRIPSSTIFRTAP
jgi:hypothetical protein